MMMPISMPTVKQDHSGGTPIAELQIIEAAPMTEKPAKSTADRRENNSLPNVGGLDRHIFKFATMRRNSRSSRLDLAC